MELTTKLLAPIIAGPYHSESHRFIATIASASPAGRQVWLSLCKPAHAQELLASRMLALLILQQDYPLLHPVLLPTAPMPACGFFFEDAHWSDARNINFPPEVRKVVDRIASTLRTDHNSFVSDFQAAIRGVRPAAFSPVTESLGVADPNGECSLVPPPPQVFVDVETLGKWATHELPIQLFHTDYRRHRYLQQMSDGELEETLGDALSNLFDVSGERKLEANLSDSDCLNALARLAEATEELVLRHGAMPADVSSKLTSFTPNVDPALTKNVLKWIKSRAPLVTNGFVKYGKRDHILNALEHGRFRIAPTSSYADPSLRRAQLADELTAHREIDVKTTKFELLSENRRDKLGDLSPIRATVSRRAATDAYVICTSRRIGVKLFGDFDADAALLVHERHEFMKRLTAASNASLPGWRLMSFDVHYYNIHSHEAHHAEPLFSKPDRYKYQQEHRIIWIPPDAQFDLKPIWVELGPLGDIAELIDVHSTEAAM